MVLYFNPTFVYTQQVDALVERIKAVAMPSIVSFTDDLALQSQLLMDVLLPEVLYFDSIVCSMACMVYCSSKAGRMLILYNNPFISCHVLLGLLFH